MIFEFSCFNNIENKTNSMFAKGALTMAGDVIKLLEEKMWEGVAAKAVAHLAK